MAYREDDREAVKGFPGITEIKGKPGVRSSWTYKTNTILKSRSTTWHIWHSGYNKNIPWRTARIETGKDGIERYTTHASHKTLREACKWLSKLD